MQSLGWGDDMYLLYASMPMLYWHVHVYLGGCTYQVKEDANIGFRLGFKGLGLEDFCLISFLYLASYVSSLFWQSMIRHILDFCDIHVYSLHG